MFRDADTTMLTDLAFWGGSGRGKLEGRLSKSAVFLGNSMTTKLGEKSANCLLSEQWLSFLRLLIPRRKPHPVRSAPWSPALAESSLNLSLSMQWHSAGLKLSHFVLWILRVARRRHGHALDKDPVRLSTIRANHSHHWRDYQIRANLSSETARRQ